MHLDNFYKPIEFQCHRSKVKVTWVNVCALFVRMIPAGST